MVWEVKMPRLDEDMTEGTVTNWIKREGDSVNKGEPIVEIETQKVVYQIEAPGSGVLRLILIKGEELVPINTILAVITDQDEDISSYRAPTSDEKVKDVQEVTASSSMPPDSSAGSPSVKKHAVSPIARKLAAEKGFDISMIQGTGPGGRITKEDVLNFKPEETSPAAPGKKRQVQQVLPFSGVRKTIADRMSESWHNSPRAENFMSVDVTELSRIREKNKEDWVKKHGTRPSVNDVIVAAVAIALKEHPIMNSALRDGNIEVYGDINISIAVAYDKGLITPVIRGADARDIFDIARETRRLAEMVREGKHSSQILADSTFTITNLGMFDVDFFVPIINPPESAILGVGKIDKKPLVINDAIAIRSVMKLCLAYDHRILDGAVAARFLQSIKGVLEDPKKVLP